MPTPSRTPIPKLVTAIAVGVFLLSPSSVRAQDVSRSTLDGVMQLLEGASGNILAAAEQVPEAQYEYRPTEEVRSLGELFSHVADAHFGYCSAIGGQEQPAAAGMDGTSKSEIVERFRASREYCLEAYLVGAEAGLAETINVFGSDNSRVWTMMQNVAHDNLHYGNIVTYLREIGMVPPSSQ